MNDTNDFYSQHFQRGALLVERHRYNEAESEFRKALALSPDAGWAHIALADAILRQKDRTRYPEVYQEAQQGVLHDPENAMAYYTLAQSLCALDKLHAAEKAMRKTVALCPDDADYHVFLAVVLLDMKRTKEAWQELKRTLALDPENRWGLYFSALLENSKGQTSEAAKYTRQLLQSAPDQAESHIALGRLLMQTGINASAEDAFCEALRIDPDNTEAYVGLLKSQKGILSKSFLLFLEIVHCLIRYRWVLMLVILAVLSTTLRSCRGTEPKLEMKSFPEYRLNEEEKKALKEALIKNARQKSTP